MGEAEAWVYLKVERGRGGSPIKGVCHACLINLKIIVC